MMMPAAASFFLYVFSLGFLAKAPRQKRHRRPRRVARVARYLWAWQAVQKTAGAYREK